MPRRAKPFFRKSTGWWMLNLRDSSGRRIQKKLVEGRKNEKVALQKYHEIMSRPQAARPTVRIEAESVWSVLDQFLVYAQENLSPKTVRCYADFLNEFAGHVGGDLMADQLKVHHVQQWLDGRDGWGRSTKAGAVSAIRRAFNWAEQQEIISRYPLKGLKSPGKDSRDVVISDQDFDAIVAASTDQRFRDLLTFLINTGARPQEACRAEVRHVELQTGRIVFPRSEAKGKRAPRVIYLNDTALEIVRRNIGDRKEGRVFRNRSGRPWAAYSVHLRFKRLAERTGRPVYCAYHLRHTFATKALTNGVDPITVATLMGHADASTLARTYQHLAKNPEHMIEAAKRAR